MIAENEERHKKIELLRSNFGAGVIWNMTSIRGLQDSNESPIKEVNSGNLNIYDVIESRRAR